MGGIIMKKVLALFIFLSIASFVNLFTLTGVPALSLSKNQQFNLDDNNISFTLGKEWKEDIDTTHDLSLNKLDANLQISVYKKDEIEIGAEDFLNEQIREELKDKYSKSIIEKKAVNKTKNRTIYAMRYMATENNIQKEYFFSIIEFDNSNTYVFVMYTARGAYMKYSIDDIERMILKMKWHGEETI